MPLIVKTGPIASNSGEVSVVERPFKGVRPELGDVVYLWICESDGGGGLAQRGRICAVEPAATQTLGLRCNELDPSIRSLGRADLRLLRNDISDVPAATLARKLYYHAHRKIAALTPEEVSYLDDYFASPLSDPDQDQ